MYIEKKKLELRMKGDVEKLLKAKLIRSIRYTEWLLNIVSIIKKNDISEYSLIFRI